MEDWIRIKEFPRYSVSRLGDVRNDLTGRIMRVKVTQGIPFVGLMGEDGLQHQRALARLVAEAFVPKENRWFTTPVNKDGDRFNNRWDNLVWRPRGFSPKYYEQFDRHYEYNYHVNRPMRDDKGQEYPDSWTAAIRNGLLEKDLVFALLSDDEDDRKAWPEGLVFTLLEL